MSDNEQERRAHPRKIVLVATEIDVDHHKGHAIGLIRDISTSGARLLSYLALDEGEKLELTLHFTGNPDGPKEQITAKVVRVEELDVKHQGLWSHSIGIKFDEELTGYAEEIEKLAELAKELGA